MSDQYYWIYILSCKNNSYYTGYTTDLNRRYKQHKAGMASKYTRSFKPVTIAQSWKIYGKKSQAMKIERYIKKLNKSEKEYFIKNPRKLLFPAI